LKVVWKYFPLYNVTKFNLWPQINQIQSDLNLRVQRRMNHLWVLPAQPAPLYALSTIQKAEETSFAAREVTCRSQTVFWYLFSQFLSCSILEEIQGTYSVHGVVIVVVDFGSWVFLFSFLWRVFWYLFLQFQGCSIQEKLRDKLIFFFFERFFDIYFHSFKVAAYWRNFEVHWYSCPSLLMSSTEWLSGTNGLRIDVKLFLSPCNQNYFGI